MCSPNMRSVSLSLSHSNCRSCQCKPILSVRRLKMVVWGSFPPFLSSLRTGGVRMSFFLFSLRRRTWSPFTSKKFFVLLVQVSSAAILFAENRYTEQFFVVFFFSRKKIFERKKNFFEDFFSWSWKTKYRNFQGEQKLRISAKMRKIGSTVSYRYGRASKTYKNLTIEMSVAMKNQWIFTHHRLQQVWNITFHIVCAEGILQFTKEKRRVSVSYFLLLH